MTYFMNPRIRQPLLPCLPLFRYLSSFFFLPSSLYVYLFLSPSPFFSFPLSTPSPVLGQTAAHQALLLGYLLLRQKPAHLGLPSWCVILFGVEAFIAVAAVMVCLSMCYILYVHTSTRNRPPVLCMPALHKQSST